MTSVVDERGYNQGYRCTGTADIRLRRRLDLILSRCGDATGKKFLEIGCGTGRLAYMLASRVKGEILATDLSAKFIAEASAQYKLPNLTFLMADFNDMTLTEENKVDFVIGNGILHHLYASLDNALAKIAGLLPKGGRIAFWEPNIFNPYCALIFNIGLLRKLARLEPGEMAFSRKYIIQRLEAAGFVNITVQYKDFLIPIAPALLVAPIVMAGAVIEEIPLLKMLAQSLFIYAEK